jgi:hypothetical protein
MNATRKLPWVLLILGAMTGCGSEEASAPPSGTPTTVAPAASPAKTTPPVANPSEMLPPPAKEETKKPDAGKKDEPPALDGPKTDATTPKSIKLTAGEIANIKKLPAGEQEVALKQVVCPVGDGPLGAMGKPVKTTAEGRTFYLCCDSCLDEVKADPKAIIAKLDKK